MFKINAMDVIGPQPNIFITYLNTGTLLDIALGTPAKCKNNYVFNGGLSNILGIGGRSQTYKSTIADSIVARVASIYPDIQVLIFDSENSKPGLKRYNDFALFNMDLTDRIRLFDTTTDDLNSIYEKIKSIVEYKKKHEKELLIETPFLDKDGKNIKIMLPTICLIDSFTVAKVNSEIENIEKSQLDSSDLNTLWMKSGKNKTIFMRQIVQYARSASIYFILTAHIGENKDLNASPYMPIRKQMQFMSQKDRLKDVGSQFEFLTNSFFYTNSPTILTSGSGNNKECYYPSIFNNAVELNKVELTITRNKVNISGILVPMVISQFEGIVDPLVYVEYLKDHCDKINDVFTQKGANMSTFIYPDVSFTRNTIREKSKKDYKLTKALEICAQFKYLKNVGSNLDNIIDLSTSTEKFMDFLLGKDNSEINDILESRSYWTYVKCDRPLLTIYDIIDKVNGLIKNNTKIIKDQKI